MFTGEKLELTREDLLTAELAVMCKIRHTADRLGIEDEDPYFDDLRLLKAKLEAKAEELR